MEVTTINQLISVGGMLFSTWLGLQVKNSFEKEHLSQKAVSQKIITEVLTPLLDALYSHNQYPLERQRELVLETVHNHRELIPPDVLECINSFLQNPDAPKSKEQLMIVTESYFNYYRKQIGYPYDSQKVRKDYIPTKSRNAIISAILMALWELFFLICGCFTIFIILFTTTHGINEIPSWAILVVPFFLFSIPFFMPRKK